MMTTYERLSKFIQDRMRMSHIYQPVMLMTLLRKRGKCTEKEIAKDILAQDQSQIEYYEKITRDMVGRVLRNHGIVERGKKNYHLANFDDLSAEQIDHLLSLCERRLNEYLESRGSLIWQHRKRSAGYISGTAKYEVLKRAGFHCDLCGVSADIKALEVDHIIPRNKGGTDDASNLQALCYSCNATKRDKDDTDFHAVRESFSARQVDCPFCVMPDGRIVLENELAFAVLDAYPVVESHTLVIPKRHAQTYFDLYQSEINACTQLISRAKSQLEKRDPKIEGFNIGINNGVVSGQTVFHCHIHLIPRRKGDVENPRGGVRHIISGRGYY
jgi:ATP adenylyltransferase